MTPRKRTMIIIKMEKFVMMMQLCYITTIEMLMVQMMVKFYKTTTMIGIMMLLLSPQNMKFCVRRILKREINV